MIKNTKDKQKKDQNRIVETTKKFDKDLKKIQRKNPTINEEIKEFLRYLVRREIPPKKYNNHRLKGKLKDLREAHIRGDLLIIYVIGDDKIILKSFGSHSQLGI